MSFRVLHSISGLLRTAQEWPLASLAGVEPATCRLGGGCSILLSYRDFACRRAAQYNVLQITLQPASVLLTPIPTDAAQKRPVLPKYWPLTW